MTRALLLAALILPTLARPARTESLGEFPPFTSWYENPLGFHPLNLHTRNGLLLPAVVAAVGMWLTEGSGEAAADRWSLFGEAGASRGYFPPFTTMFQTNAGVLYRARSWLALIAELDVYAPNDRFNGTVGLGVRPLVRFFLYQRASWRVFLESGAGLIYFAREFPAPTSGYGPFSDPRTGTHLNGTPLYGGGLEVDVGRGLRLSAGLQHVHVSNGNAVGSERNPGHDSNGVFIGVSRR